MITTIKLSTATKHELDLLREYKNESYEEVVSKLIYISKNVKKKPELSAEVIDAIEKARARMKAGKFVTHEEVKRRLGIK